MPRQKFNIPDSLTETELLPTGKNGYYKQRSQAFKKKTSDKLVDVLYDCGYSVEYRTAAKDELQSRLALSAIKDEELDAFMEKLLEAVHTAYPSSNPKAGVLISFLGTEFYGSVQSFQGHRNKRTVEFTAQASSLRGVLMGLAEELIRVVESRPSPIQCLKASMPGGQKGGQDVSEDDVPF